MKPHLRITVQTLLGRGSGQREIERMTGVDRKTIRRIGRELAGTGANSPGVATGSDGRERGIFGDENPPPPRPPARVPKLARSACEVRRAWIEEQVQLGRNVSVPRPTGWPRSLAVGMRLVHGKRPTAYRLAA